jgi:hypothetical protein
VSVSLFVYYRVADAPDAAVRERVGAVQADLLATTGVPGRLLRRRDDPATWMEIYELVSDAGVFEQALDEALARHGFEALLAPGDARHTERFVNA